MNQKLILDACCGGRTMWFNKNHPNALYIDIRKEEKGFDSHRPNFDVQPDRIMDFRDLKFKDKSFKLVVWDPPHLKKLQETSWLAKKYGILNAQTYPSDLRKGFSECWRVLEDNGILIFKWNDVTISHKEVLSYFAVEPLFGHSTGSKSKTRWFCFMKIVEKKK